MSPWPYLKLELRRALVGSHLVVLPIGLVLGVVSSLVVPTLPAQLVRFIERAMHLHGPVEFVIFSTYISLFVAVYWMGAFKLLRAYLVPFEERSLSVYLAKPLPRLYYLLARVLPELLVVLACGGLIAAGEFFITRWLNGPVLVAPYCASCAIILGLALLWLAAVDLAYLYLQELAHGVVVAFLLWLPLILPFQIFVYRPEALPGRALQEALVFPANLIWLGARVEAVAAVVVPACIAAATGLLWLAARRLERMEVP